MESSIFFEGPIPASFIAELVTHLQTDHHTGAYNFFLGKVRADVEADKVVTSIEFSAYKPMATKLIQEICADACGAFSLREAKVYHSLGQVQTGELCFVVMVAAAHRSKVYVATQHIVNQVKEKVPIFGKEWHGESHFQWKQNQ